MNPAHLFLISFALLATFWLGVVAALVEEVTPFLYIPAIALNLAAATGLVVSIGQLVSRAL